MSRHQKLLNFYAVMQKTLGPSNWWPGDSPFEVCLGAILTQNTNWSNVQKALIRLKAESLLDPEKIFSLGLARLSEIIKPAGYFRVKGQRILNFLAFLKESADFQLELLAERPLDDLRTDLLAVNGIGPETADSMLLYAFSKPSFVVDSYTARICNRHSLTHEDIGYEELRSFFMDVLPPDVAFYNEYHALLVRTGKNWCLKREGKCRACPLRSCL
ncbi:MAG: endonuclease III domain-containing protein [Desulfohalobiaceae bacterium]|nr:endonuclease III domain-containing protein [Desulfohalobiaceae bacterium]